MIAVLILGWLTIAALVLIARVDYRTPRGLITDTAARTDAKLRVRPQRLPSTHAAFRAPPLPEAVFADSK